MTSAVIFDMNGVIVDDERIHQESWRVFCKKHGFNLSEEEFKEKVFGRTEKDTFSYLFNREISEEELEKYSNERVDFAIAIFKPKIKMTEGLEKFLNDLICKVPMGVATSARRRHTDFIMDELNIRKYFDVIITAQDITKGKPDPEIYLKAADLLKVEPPDCVVIEDTVSGIKAGKAAGMKVIGIATTHKKEELGIADKVIDSFDQLSFGSLNSI